MDLDALTAYFLSLPTFAQWAWASVLLAVLAAIGLLLVWERRYYVRRGLAIGWLGMRLCSILLLALCVAVVLIPAMTISGPEALAYFYIALFTLAPALWFGGHLLCGRLATPRLTRSESLSLAATGLLILALPVVGISVASGPIAQASHALREASFQRADSQPLPHAVDPIQRFEMPEAGLVYTQSLRAPAGIHIERIDQKAGDLWFDTSTSSRTLFCRDGANLHLMWSAKETMPPLRIYWRDTAGKRQQAVFEAGAQGSGRIADPRPFVVEFRDDGIDPIVPIPRSRASIGYTMGGEKVYFNLLNPLQAGETFDNDCIQRGYRRVAWEKEGPPQVIALMFHLPGNRPPLRAEIWRPDSRFRPDAGTGVAQ